MAAVALVLGTAGTVRADEGRTIATNGQACVAAYGAAGQVGYGEPGIGNYSSSGARIFCASQLDTINYNYQGLVTNSYLEVQAFDYSTTVDYWCYPWADDQGTNFWGPTKHTCSGWGGCPDPTTSFTGMSWLYWYNPFPGGHNRSLTYGVSCNLAPSSWLQFMWSSNVQQGSN
jgi:hypothetical protein